jgi:hypothetical protein
LTGLQVELRQPLARELHLEARDHPEASLLDSESSELAEQKKS